ncbi:hypothetical protein FQN60_008302 [Etheostoma spectabile]|uniref:Uncharacterized protein n=1 Tax=Etheostoma spectabile TaxID=54343 RepID=A0A5J5CS04_9PERO|nr:hypothetical protein FQN60_008302 [Etheostoma spectabile]
MATAWAVSTRPRTSIQRLAGPRPAHDATVMLPLKCLVTGRLWPIDHQRLQLVLNVGQLSPNDWKQNSMHIFYWYIFTHCDAKFYMLCNTFTFFYFLYCFVVEHAIFLLKSWQIVSPFYLCVKFVKCSKLIFKCCVNKKNNIVTLSNTLFRVMSKLIPDKQLCRQFVIFCSQKQPRDTTN